MNTPRFLVAKYAADLQRMEPRNIGVFLWHRGRTEWRFLPEEKAASFVTELSTYRQWVEYWQALVEGEMIDVPGFGIVPKRSEECINAILGTQEGNYLLVDAGFVAMDVPADEMPLAADFLFAELVGTGDSRSSNSHSADKPPAFPSRCDALFETAGIAVKRNEPVACRALGGATKHFRCDYYIGNGHPEAVFQRANLGNEQSVSHAGLLLHELLRNEIVADGHCGALVEIKDRNNAMVREAFDWLKSICPVIDVNATSAATKLRKIATRSNG